MKSSKGEKLGYYLAGFMSGVIVCLITFFYSSAEAGRSLRFSDIHGWGWIFILIGLIIVLLQLIPAVLLFVSSMWGFFRKEKDGTRS